MLIRGGRLARAGRPPAFVRNHERTTGMATSCIAALLACAFGIAGDEGAPKGGGAAKSAAAVDRALAPDQEKLLDLAFKAASALPDNPHLKNRCRMQGD